MTMLLIAQIEYEVEYAAMLHAESYEEGETEDEIEQYYEGVSGHFEDYNSEKHDGLKPGGGSFADDFEIING